jgi:hypothetical protein
MSNCKIKIIINIENACCHSVLRNLFPRQISTASERPFTMKWCVCRPVSNYHGSEEPVLTIYIYLAATGFGIPPQAAGSSSKPVDVDNL